jgi:hypothetical protein
MIDEMRLSYHITSSAVNMCCNGVFNSINKKCVYVDSSVGIATRYELDVSKTKSRCGAIFSANVQTGPGAHPVSSTMGTGSFPGVKRPGRSVDHPLHLALRLRKE